MKLLQTIDGAATVNGAADAAFVVGVQGRLIVDRDLFARCDVTQRDKENVVIENLHVRVGRARVIDVMRAIAAAAAVETVAMVDFADS